MADESTTTTSAGLYSKINPWQTRILRLHPGQRGEALSGDLLVADIVQLPGLVLHDEQQRVEYSAISYAWGEPTFDRQVTVNGTEVAITRSLYGALRCFRKAEESRYLWADALCIQQKSEAEKSFQVRNIFTIFSKAAYVLAWLGEASEGTEHAVRYIITAIDHGASKGGTTTEHRVAKRADDSAHDGLVDLCSRPWVSRAWAQQEVFAARDLTLYCGHCTITLEQYRLAGEYVERHRDASDVSSEMGEINLTGHIESMRELHQATQIDQIQLSEQRARAAPGICKYKDLNHFDPLSICTRPECILANHRNVLASDPRDRIYALIALMDCQVSSSAVEQFDDEKALSPVDYTLSVSQVFQLLAKYIINRDRSLGLLELISPSDNGDLPSWTPDWRLWSCHVALASGFREDHAGNKSFLRQSYNEWDVLCARGFTAGTFHLEGELMLNLSRPTPYFPAAYTQGTPQAAAKLFKDSAGRIADGDLLVNFEADELIGVVLRRRPRGGYTFVCSHPRGNITSFRSAGGSLGMKRERVYPYAWPHSVAEDWQNYLIW